MSYYLILSRGTYGRYKASPGNVVRLLTAMSKDVLVSERERESERGGQGERLLLVSETVERGGVRLLTAMSRGVLVSESERGGSGCCW
jgi:hypothetical protein